MAQVLRRDDGEIKIGLHHLAKYLKLRFPRSLILSNFSSVNRRPFPQIRIAPTQKIHGSLILRSFFYHRSS